MPICSLRRLACAYLPSYLPQRMAIGVPRGLRRLAQCMLVLSMLGVFSAGQAQVPAPALVTTTIDGQKVALKDLRGKVVVVTFWATTCAICLAEQPDLVKTYERYRSRGLEVVVVAMSYDRPDLIKRHLSRYPMPFKVVWDQDGQIVGKFGGVLGTPTTFIVDRKGQLISRTTGAIAFDKLERLLNKSLPPT